jgi:hypothetical protein
LNGPSGDKWSKNHFLSFFSVKIGLFYIVYYAFLTGFFMAMLFVFYQTLDDEVPKWLNSNGIIGDNPGMIFILLSTMNQSSLLIRFLKRILEPFGCLHAIMLAIYSN